MSLLLLLRTRRKLTAEKAGDEPEMSGRIIYRDVESLHTVGIPLYGDADPAGGYQLLGGYWTRPTGLSADEAQALFLAALLDFRRFSGMHRLQAHPARGRPCSGKPERRVQPPWLPPRLGAQRRTLR
ncbi:MULTISPECIES: HTH domain-containing protein [unclassified Streptomyces]|uniref:HTH domain-containing protein n=1 Tax=unclassified Streptomyces TaxID=2593676 RepID=UPI00336A1FD1